VLYSRNWGPVDMKSSKGGTVKGKFGFAASRDLVETSAGRGGEGTNRGQRERDETFSKAGAMKSSF